MSYPTSITTIPNIVQDSDGSRSESVTIPSSSPYTYRLGTNSPLLYPAGYQAVPPSGIPGIVSVSGGGYGSWSEVSSAPAGGQFMVDYTASTTGGTITFSATDAGKSITITWTGATLVNETLMMGLITALRDLKTMLGGGPQGTATDLTTRLALFMDSTNNLLVPSGEKIKATGQTGGPTGGATVANQAIGAMTIASSTANGSTVTYNNSLITTSSYIWIQPRNTGAGSSFVAYCPIVSQASGSVSFYVMTNGGAATNSSNDVTILILN